jgi:methionyl-tRNA formyltransferase
MGTPYFGKEILKKLHTDFSIHTVVCQPDKPTGRKKEIVYSEVKNYALRENLRILQPEKIKNNESFLNELKAINPDFIFVAAYGKILTKDILNIPKLACINVHSSLLPKYRGAAPINWALINGDKETGVTIMEMDEGMDTGNIILSKKIAIEEDDNVLSLTEKLASIGCDAIGEFFKKFLETGCINSKPQDNRLSSIAPKIEKEICKIDWNKNSFDILNLIRGSNPWPGATTTLSKSKITIWEAQLAGPAIGRPGSIKKIEKKMFVSCKDKEIEIIKIQKSGKNTMDGKSFINGISIGEKPQFK